jgi:PAS domain S-box-containing protein
MCNDNLDGSYRIHRVVRAGFRPRLMWAASRRDLIEAGSHPGVAGPTTRQSDCALEPIHIPGSIQPHGAVLVLSADGGTVTHASANVSAFLGVSVSDMLGRPFESAVGEVAAAKLCDPLARRVRSWQIPGPAAVGAGTLHLQSHRSGPRIVVDIETLYSDAWQHPDMTQVQLVLKSFENAKSRLELCELAVRGLREITGHDRIMAYRFGPEGHGEVVAEACALNLDPYLGQRYPASDIPSQARQLYLSQRVGVIVDSAYVPVALMADFGSDDTGPVDLTGSSLRSVSPVHREFMRNMKTAASMTIGLAQEARGDRELWGMLVCHHATPRVVGPELRAVADVLGQVVSLLLASRGATEASTEKLARNQSLRTLMNGLAVDAPLVETMSDMRSELLQLTDSSGALVRFNGHLMSLGSAPDGPLAKLALELLKPDLGAELRAVDDLSLQYPQLASCAQEYSGALMVSLSRNTDDSIIWFRPEQEQTITWGGNPRKPIVTDPNSGAISPRASFEAWKEVVHARSLPWSNAVLAVAIEFREAIEREVARRTKIELKLFDRMFEGSPIALLLIGTSGLVRLLNRQAEKLFGFERMDLQGKPVGILFPPSGQDDERGQVLDYIANPLQRQMTEGLRIVGLRNGGSSIPLEVALNPLEPTMFGGETMVQMSITDLTARLENEKQKLQAQSRLRSVAQHVPAMIGYWNRDLICEFANEGYRVWFGLGPEQIVGMTMRDLLGESLDRHNAPYVQRVLAGQAAHYETIISQFDGTPAYADARYVPDFADSGQVQGFYMLVTDISPLHRATLALESVNSKLTYTIHELDQFVYTASHDLRSPLRAISSLAQFILQDDLQLGGETTERLTLIRSRAMRMQNMLNDILAYARAGESGHLPGASPIAVDQIVREVVMALSPPVGFTIRTQPLNHAVRAFSVPLSQVLQNCIGNAIKHHDHTSGAVDVAVADCGDHWKFSVTDDGPGIPEAYRESVFEMFSTLKSRDQVEGSGMGLALVRKIVRRMGGACGISPRTERGTCVWFDWPKVPVDGVNDNP